MRRSFVLILSIFLALGSIAVAQEETPPEDPVVGEANEAMVRFLHAAPNAEISNVVLTTGDGETVDVGAFAGVGYGELTDYVAVPAVGYDVTVNLAVVEGEEASGVEVPADALDTFPGEYYTIILMGVVRPAEDAAEDTGFFEWLEGLFTDEDDRFALRAMVISDVTQFAVDENETEVRIVHVAPGTEAVDLVVVDSEGANVVHNVGYGDVSGFERIVASGTMELRVAGSEAAILDLSDQPLDSGASNTIFLIGTPVEEVPLEVVVALNPVITAAAAPGAVGALPPAISTDRTWMRDSLNEIEARLANIEDRLRVLAEGDGTEEDVNAALEQVAEAMALIDDARDQMAAQPAPAPDVPPAEPTDPAEPADDGN